MSAFWVLLQPNRSAGEVARAKHGERFRLLHRRGNEDLRMKKFVEPNLYPFVLDEQIDRFLLPRFFGLAGDGIRWDTLRFDFSRQIGQRVAAVCHRVDEWGDQRQRTQRWIA
jgi:hypothetical protein